MDTETDNIHNFFVHPHTVAPPSIRLWILKLIGVILTADFGGVAPPSIRLWILKQNFGGLVLPEPDVAPPSIRLWILKRHLK